MTKVLIVEGLGKRFKRYHKQKPNTLMQAVLSGLKRMQPTDEFWALRDVGFSVSPGEVLGVLGRNGAGKSTLLQLVGGVGKAEEGHVWVNGRIGALLDMGAGFHGDLSGRENLIVSGLIAGLTKQQVLSRFDEIVDFAELDAFIESPMRTYSSGMRMRLAFSIAIHNDPDLLLVDEHLSVGDIGFKSKCIERIEQLRSGGCGIVLISQDPIQVQSLCDRALLLNQGRVVAYDAPTLIREQYERQMGVYASDDAEALEKEGDFSHSPLRIGQVKQSPSGRITNGQPLSIEIEIDYASSRPIINQPNVSFRIVDLQGQNVFATQSPLLKEALPSEPQSDVRGSGKFSVHFERLDLPSGDYYIDLGIHSQDWSKTYDYHYRKHPLTVRSTAQSTGYLNPPYRWELMDMPAEMPSAY